jgi:aminoglycoside phosphotransferase (APT) family kinase protein
MLFPILYRSGGAQVPEVQLDAIAEPHREAARTALDAAFGARAVTAVEPVAGGASGALTFRVESGGRPCMLRIETRRGPMRNPHQYACMRIAAEAGVAPPVRYADDAAGVAIMDFVPQRPLAEFPGGPLALAAALGDLARRLQAAPAFPALADYRDIAERMLRHVEGAGVFAAGLLDRHFEGLARLRAAYPWDPQAHVSSHNDPNPQNVLFDGERLWLIDWETAYRNDPLVDVAILSHTQGLTCDQEVALVQSWLGRAPDRTTLARLTLMKPLTRLYYAGLLFMVVAGVARDEPDPSLDAPTPDEFRAQLARGEHSPTSPHTGYLLAKMQLAGFLSALAAPGYEEALAAAGEAA